MLAQDVGHLWLFLPPLCTILDENGIVFEVEVSRDEALASLEFYKHTCPGPSSISSLQGVLQVMDRGGVWKHSHSCVSILFIWNFYLAASHLGSCWVQHPSLVYQGRRSRKKTDLSMKMYEEEIQVRNCNIVRNWSYRLILFHTLVLQEWYTEYSRESLPEQDQSLQPRPGEPVSDPSSYLEPRLNSQTGPHSIN